MPSNRYETSSWSNIIYALTHRLVHDAPTVDVGQWQSSDISDKPEMVTREMFDVTVKVAIPNTADQLAEMVGPNLPWAEDHFRERVSGHPLNPPPSHEWWPFNQQNNEEWQQFGRFSHTYPERFWPKDAADNYETNGLPMLGIRFKYGDLKDVVDLLNRSPMTRQAYLPVWFPEDTGVVHGERVPCTLGYHFIIRHSQLHCIYYMRSCDFLRHFPDDVYLACRLTQWLSDQVGTVPGKLTMHITSLHVFEGDMPTLRGRLETD